MFKLKIKETQTIGDNQLKEDHTFSFAQILVPTFNNQQPQISQSNTDRAINNQPKHIKGFISQRTNNPSQLQQTKQSSKQQNNNKEMKKVNSIMGLLQNFQNLKEYTKQIYNTSMQIIQQKNQQQLQQITEIQCLQDDKQKLQQENEQMHQKVQKLEFEVEEQQIMMNFDGRREHRIFYNMNVEIDYSQNDKTVLQQVLKTDDDSGNKQKRLMSDVDECNIQIIDDQLSRYQDLTKKYDQLYKTYQEHVNDLQDEVVQIKKLHQEQLNKINRQQLDLQNKHYQEIHDQVQTKNELIDQLEHQNTNLNKNNLKLKEQVRQLQQEKNKFVHEMMIKEDQQNQQHQQMAVLQNEIDHQKQLMMIYNKNNKKKSYDDDDDDDDDDDEQRGTIMQASQMIQNLQNIQYSIQDRNYIRGDQIYGNISSYMLDSISQNDESFGNQSPRNGSFKNEQLITINDFQFTKDDNLNTDQDENDQINDQKVQSKRIQNLFSFTDQSPNKQDRQIYNSYHDLFIFDPIHLQSIQVE